MSSFYRRNISTCNNCCSVPTLTRFDLVFDAKNLGPAEKEKFVKLADEDKDRYLEEMRVWEAKQRGVNLKAAKVCRTLDWSDGAQFCLVVFDNDDR